MKKNFNDTKSGSDRYIVGEINQFDQKNEMFKRMIWDPEIKDIGEKFYMTPVPPKTKQGYHLKDFSMINAAWHLEDHYGNGIWGGKKDLYGWDGIGEYSYPGVPRGLKIDLENPQSVTDAVRKAGQFYGAAKVGMCKFDRRWLYSRGYTKKERPDAGEARPPRLDGGQAFGHGVGEGDPPGREPVEVGRYHGILPGEPHRLPPVLVGEDVENVRPLGGPAPARAGANHRAHRGPGRNPDEFASTHRSHRNTRVSYQR